MKEQQTSKKIKFVGTEQFLNVSTGEIEDFQVIKVENRDFNFTKVWMKNFLISLGLIGNKKMKVCFWIIDNLDKENKLIYTQRQIAEKSNVALNTVMKTMYVLQNSKFLKKQNSGCYIINPNVLFKGTRNNRLNALTVFQATGVKEKKKSTIDDQIKSYQEAMNFLQEKLDKLIKQKNSKKRLKK
jgi:DNA-binding transcriptional regulator YhcF (GntR family)